MSVPNKRMTVIDGGAGKDSGGGSGGGKGSHDDWRSRLTRTGAGRVESTAHNLMLILEMDKHLAGLFRLDTFANRVTLTRDAPWPGGTKDEFADADGTELCAWLGDPERYSMSPRQDAVMSSVEAVARRRAFHPVREYLETLRWDGTPRVIDMLANLFGVDASAYASRVSECMMVSAVARVLWVDRQVAHNGAKVDFMVVFEGNQGRGKGTGISTLCGPQWFAEMQESPQSKDFYQTLLGRWFVEMSEMESFSKADVKKVKQAISTRFDTYRPSYGRIARSFRRECVFSGTTNEDKYLRDPTGARRFLPVTVSRPVNIAGIAAQRDQLWAEAVRMFHDKHQWWVMPPEAADEQEKRYQIDSWEEVIQPWLNRPADNERYPHRLLPGDRVEWVTVTEVLSYALRLEVAKHNKQDQMRVAAIMHRIGWENIRSTIAGERQWRWMRKQGGGDDPPF